MSRSSPIELTNDVPLHPLNPDLVDDVFKTVEDARRRLHSAQMADSAERQVNESMHKVYTERHHLTATARAPAMWQPSQTFGGTTFFPVATAPVDRLTVALPSTLLPRYARAAASHHVDEDERPVWNASTQVSSLSVPAQGASSARVALKPPSSRPVRVVFTTEQLDGPSSDHTHTWIAPSRHGVPRAQASPHTVDASRNEVVSLSDAALAAVQEQELAVRDYLRRMNILGASPPDDPNDERLHDPIYNASAAVRLTLCILDTQSQPYVGSPIVPPTLRVRTMPDAERNYACLRHLLSPQRSGDDPTHLVPDALLSALSAKVCLLHRDPRPMLSLLVYLIAHHMPPPEELPYHVSTLTTQVPVDVGDKIAPTSPAGGVLRGAALWEAERALCSALFTYGVLPDPAAHELPGDDCVVPNPIAAPFLSSQSSRSFVPRTTEPAALYIPSVFPYLCNGVALVALAKRCVPDALLVEVRPMNTSVSANPRTRRSCLANIMWALARFERLYTEPSALHDTSAAEMIFRGYRAGIVALLLSVVERARLCECGTGGPPLMRQSPVQERDATTRESSTAAGAGPTTSPPSRANATDRVSPAPVSNSADRAADRAITDRQHWLVRTLGSDTQYVAEDGSFSFAELRTHPWREPCYAFSDGVLLSRLLSRLERRRCPALDRVRATTKAAAKRFNIGQCLSFLASEKRLDMDTTAVTEGLLVGSVDVVERVIDILRQTYKTM